MPSFNRYETERAQVVWNPLKSFNAQVLPRFVAQVAQVTCKPLISLVPRFCPGVPQCSPHTPHTGGARLRAARTRNEVGSDRALETRVGQPDVVDVDRRRLGLATTRVQPRALPLAPSSRQNFQLAQRLIRDVSGGSLGGLVGRLIGHSSHSNGGLDDVSHWLTKRSVRAAAAKLPVTPKPEPNPMDLTPLRPRADTPDAVLEAIDRCTVAGRACVALIEKLKQDRLGLLMSGHSDQLRMNAADTAATQADAAEIAELIGFLQERMQQQAPEQVAEVAAQKRAIEAAAVMSAWWATNIGIVTDGLQKMGVAFAALGELQSAVAQTNAAAEAARRTAANVVPIAPRPIA